MYLEALVEPGVAQRGEVRWICVELCSARDLYIYTPRAAAFSSVIGKKVHE